MSLRITNTLGVILFLVLVPLMVQAQAYSLLSHDAAMSERRALLPRAPRSNNAALTASLFIGQEGGSLFAPFPKRAAPQADRIYVSRNGTQVERLRHLIAKAEAGPKQYDAVQYGARIKTPKPPTQMTIAEIYNWIDATPGQPHAIGRYQFIPPTLRSLVKRLGIDKNARFSPRVQDQLANILLVEAGLIEASKGEMPRHAFMNNLAKIWAGLPNSTGKSHYHGHAGNKASMTWGFFDREMARIFPS